MGRQKEVSGREGQTVRLREAFTAQRGTKETGVLRRAPAALEVCGSVSFCFPPGPRRSVSAVWG